MRILFITQLFDPEPHFKGLPFVRELQRLGHEVRVITGFPNYPGGKIYPGYRMRFWQREDMEGVWVLRVPLYPSHDRRALARITTYVTFGISSTLAAVFMPWQPEVVYAYHMPATIAIPAMAMRILRGVPFVYDVNDLWPDSLSATGMVNSPILLKLVDWWSRLTYSMASRVTVIAPGLKNAIVSRGVPSYKVTPILNWCDQKTLTSPDAVPEAGFEGKFVVLFAGNMGIAQHLDTVIAAARMLTRAQPQVVFAMVGSGVVVEPLRAQVAAEKLGNVMFLGRRPPAAMGPIFARADALLVHLRDDPLFAISIPSKTQAYMAAGKPILMGVRGDAAELVSKAKAGLLFAPEDSDGLVGAVEKLVAMPAAERKAMGEAGRDYYERHLSLEAGVRAYAQELSIAGGWAAAT